VAAVERARKLDAVHRKADAIGGVLEAFGAYIGSGV